MSRKLFAIPTIEEKLCAHFGHCEKFAIVQVEDDKIISALRWLLTQII